MPEPTLADINQVIMMMGDIAEGHDALDSDHIRFLLARASFIMGWQYGAYSKLRKENKELQGRIDLLEGTTGSS
jgi:hypothetical protein